jgi:hypothetical protein
MTEQPFSRAASFFRTRGGSPASPELYVPRKNLILDVTPQNGIEVRPPALLIPGWGEKVTHPSVVEYASALSDSRSQRIVAVTPELPQGGYATFREAIQKNWVKATSHFERTADAHVELAQLVDLHQPDVYTRSKGAIDFTEVASKDPDRFQDANVVMVVPPLDGRHRLLTLTGRGAKIAVRKYLESRKVNEKSDTENTNNELPYSEIINFIREDIVGSMSEQMFISITDIRPRLQTLRHDLNLRIGDISAVHDGLFYYDKVVNDVVIIGSPKEKALAALGNPDAGFIDIFETFDGDHSEALTNPENTMPQVIDIFNRLQVSRLPDVPSEKP